MTPAAIMKVTTVTRRKNLAVFRRFSGVLSVRSRAYCLAVRAETTLAMDEIRRAKLPI